MNFSEFQNNTLGKHEQHLDLHQHPILFFQVKLFDTMLFELVRIFTIFLLVFAYTSKYIPLKNLILVLRYEIKLSISN